MPIAASTPALAAQISNAFSLGTVANQTAVALIITSAIASIAPSGLFPLGTILTPLIPAGFSACQNQIENSLNLGIAANPTLVGQIMGLAISVLCPIVPPIGLIALQNQLKNALNLQQTANPQTVGNALASAIITYYTSSGVI